MFPNLTHLSLCNNQISSIDELAKIGMQPISEEQEDSKKQIKLEYLTIKGNYFVERHPDHKALIIRHFPKLKELDSLAVD